MSENRGDNSVLSRRMCRKWNTERSRVSMIRAVHLYSKNKSILWADESNPTHQSKSQRIVERSLTLSSHYFPIPLISLRNTTRSTVQPRYMTWQCSFNVFLWDEEHQIIDYSYIQHNYSTHNHGTVTQHKIPSCT